MAATAAATCICRPDCIAKESFGASLRPVTNEAQPAPISAIALWRLGERESGTARLEEAVEAYRAALEE